MHFGRRWLSILFTQNLRGLINHVNRLEHLPLLCFLLCYRSGNLREQYVRGIAYLFAKATVMKFQNALQQPDLNRRRELYDMVKEQVGPLLEGKRDLSLKIYLPQLFAGKSSFSQDLADFEFVRSIDVEVKRKR